MAGSFEFHDQHATQEVQRTVIAFASAADHTIAAAVTGKKARLLSFVASMTGTAPTIRFESGAGGTALSGVIIPTSGSVVSMPHNPLGWLESASGQALSLEVTGTSPSIQGVATWVYVDADGRTY